MNKDLNNFRLIFTFPTHVEEVKNTKGVEYQKQPERKAK